MLAMLLGSGGYNQWRCSWSEVPGGRLKCRVSLSQSAACKKAGRSDHGEMDGNCLQVVDERTRSEPRNAIHAAMRANLEYLNSK